MEFEEEIRTQVHTKTATGTYAAIVVALSGAALIAAAGVVGLQQTKNEKPVTVENTPVVALVQDAVRQIDTNRSPIIVEGHATYTNTTVKRVDFISQMSDEVMQSGTKLTRYYDWPTLPAEYLGSTQKEEQFIQITRPRSVELYGTSSSVPSVFIEAGPKKLNFLQKMPLQEFAVDPLYTVPVRTTLPVPIDSLTSLKTFLHTVSLSRASVVQLNPREEKVSTDQLRQGDVSALLAGLQGMDWLDFLPDDTKPYTAEIVFNNRSKEINRIYITGSDVDILLYISKTEEIFVEELKEYVEAGALATTPFFLDTEEYNGLEDNTIKNYAVQEIANNPLSLNSWYFQKVDSDVFIENESKNEERYELRLPEIETIEADVYAGWIH